MATIDILEERYKAAKKLQPCPFCGGTYKDTLTILADDYSRFYVICFSGRSGSGCGMESFRSYSLDDLVQRWNTRTDPAGAVYSDTDSFQEGAEDNDA